MKVLIIGSGGREHSLGIHLSRSPLLKELYFAPGNPGMENLGTCIPLAADNIPEICAFAQEINLDLVIVGPEVPLVAGLADQLRSHGIAVFGPGRLAAQLEGSKAFSKEFMAKYQIPTASFKNFSQLAEAQDYLKKHEVPVLVKASGLAAGKGAIICNTHEEAQQAVNSMLGPQAIFGEAGQEIVIEEFMEGEEASLFAICDGENYRLLAPAQDHKRIFDQDQGPNTGGMGAYAPAPLVTPEILEQIQKTIIEPTLQGMQTEGMPYIGTLFVGLMINRGKAKVIEYNCRFGDPETQAVLPLYTGDLLELLNAAAKGQLAALKAVPPPCLAHTSKKFAAVVVLASKGYPASSSSGQAISGLSDVEKVDSVHVVHAGTRKSGPTLETAGGRVLGVVAEGQSLKNAIDKAYQGVNLISFDGMQYRRDIGAKGLKYL